MVELIFTDSVNELSKHFKPFQPENDTTITQFFFNQKNQNELLWFSNLILILATFLFSKVLEKAVAQQLTACLEENNLLYPKSSA